MPRTLPRPRALLLALALAARAAAAQAVLGPAEDATIAPVGALRFRIANSWQHYGQTLIGDSLRAQNYSQVRVTNVSAEFGVLPRLSLAFIMPESGTLVTTTWASFVSGAYRTDSLVNRSHNGIGDVEIAAKIAWLAGPNEQARIALGPGVHLRSALSGNYRFATGTPPDPTDQFGIATGSGRTAVSAASQTDVMVGRIFWMSAVGRMTWPGAVARTVLVRAPGQTLSPDLGDVDATQTGGNSWSVEVTPRAVLGRYFAVGAQYQYLHRDASMFVGTKDTAFNSIPVTLDAATLDSSSAGTAQYLSGMVTYSTVAAYLQGKAGFPIEISYSYTATLSATGAAPREAATNTVTVRLWARLWGSAFKRAAP